MANMRSTSPLASLVVLAEDADDAIAEVLRPTVCRWPSPERDRAAQARAEGRALLCSVLDPRRVQRVAVRTVLLVHNGILLTPGATVFVATTVGTLVARRGVGPRSGGKQSRRDLLGKAHVWVRGALPCFCLLADSPGKVWPAQLPKPGLQLAS